MGFFRELGAHLYNTYREDRGHPATLYRLLGEQPQMRTLLAEPKRSIAASSVVRWHEWGETGAGHWACSRSEALRGWKYAGGLYHSFETELSELREFGLCDITEYWECDIRDVEGLSGSKSNLEEFASMDDMAQKRSQGLIDEITEEGLRKNLAHVEIRILRESKSDHFIRHLWDGRVFLMNAGGSHHFSAARYIAGRLNHPVPLRGKLYTYGINQKAVASLRRKFDLYAISADPTAFLGFFEAMQAFRAAYLRHYMPRPYANQCNAILLPRADPRSAKVSAVLREAGFFDLGEYLSSLAARKCA